MRLKKYLFELIDVKLFICKIHTLICKTYTLICKTHI